MGDETQFAQLFQNLISNALKYAKPGVAPLIQIYSERLNNEWVISVRDNGIGFRQEFAGHIFGLFKRLHRGEYPGTGLGLAICKRIVERYGGRIWATSQPGEGSTFSFALEGIELKN
jgi:signal transduction histidine kinase